MIKKIDQLRDAMNANDWKKALSIAAKFPRLGNHKIEIIRAHEAITRPRFYEQIGMNPDEIINTGISALLCFYTSINLHNIILEHFQATTIPLS